MRIQRGVDFLAIWTCLPTLMSGNDLHSFNYLENLIEKKIANCSAFSRPRPGMLMTNKNELTPNSGTLFVEVGFFIFSIWSVSVVNMDFSMDVLLRQRWHEPRLGLNWGKNFSHMPINRFLEKIWVPDLFFRNARGGKKHDITIPNQLVWVDSNGVITYSQKLTLHLSCDMKLWDFPMDSQLCTVNFGSYGFTKNELQFRWWNEQGYDRLGSAQSSTACHNSVIFHDGLTLSEFELQSYSCQSCDAEYDSTGDFSCLEIGFVLQRKFGFYLIYAYLPSLLLVVIAWMSFFIDQHAVAARISLGLLSVLALITQCGSLVSQLPRVSYVKAIDVWFFVSLAFVVSSLLEFAFVNIAARREARRKESVSVPSLPTTSNATTTEEQTSTQATSQYLRDFCFIDRASAVIYPIMFLIFNLVYWLTYQNKTM